MLHKLDDEFGDQPLAKAFQAKRPAGRSDAATRSKTSRRSVQVLSTIEKERWPMSSMI